MNPNYDIKQNWAYIGNAEEFISFDWPRARHGKHICVLRFVSGAIRMGMSHDPHKWTLVERNACTYPIAPKWKRGGIDTIMVSQLFPEERWRDIRREMQALVAPHRVWPTVSTASLDTYVKALAIILKKIACK